jgi:predicted AlkP superfamily pyrophosphatase or phosphodiesterase
MLRVCVQWHRRFAILPNRPCLLACILGALLVVAAPGIAQETSARSGDVVVLVSFDGFRHDYLDRGITPNFERIARAGVRADAIIPIFPSKTFPNHHSIATGLYAEHHGIVGNEFYDPVLGLYGNENHEEMDQGRWFGGEPIWVTAERQGVTSGAFFWVATDFKVGGILPTYRKKYDGDVPWTARIDTVVSWLQLPEQQRPRLVLLYFETMDDAGHRYGPDTPQVDSALVQADALLGRLLDGISRTPVAARTSLIVVSDHGMAGVGPDRTVPIDSADLKGARVVVSGAYSTLYFGGDTLRRNQVASKLKRSLSHVRVFPRDSIPDVFHWRDNPRIPDVLIVADEGWLVGPRRSMERVRVGGTHGYDPASPTMRGIFLAMGPRIKPNQRIPAFENVHVHPFIAALLGIWPAENIDGSLDVLRPVLR